MFSLARGKVERPFLHLKVLRLGADHSPDAGIPGRQIGKR
jgi:hypothetical protein